MGAVGSQACAVGQSAVVRFGAGMKTAYEIDRYEGDRQTLVCAVEFIDGVAGGIAGGR